MKEVITSKLNWWEPPRVPGPACQVTLVPTSAQTEGGGPGLTTAGVVKKTATWRAESRAQDLPKQSDLTLATQLLHPTSSTH